jgi:hypothetical protein
LSECFGCLPAAEWWGPMTPARPSAAAVAQGGGGGGGGKQVGENRRTGAATNWRRNGEGLELVPLWAFHGLSLVGLQVIGWTN